MAPFEDIYFDAFDKKTPSEDIPNLTNAPVTSSAVVPAAVPTQTKVASNVALPALSIENGEAPPLPSIPEEKKPAPPVYGMAPSDFSNLTNTPVTESAVEHVAAATVISENTNETKSEEKPAPTTPSVNEVAPSDFSKSYQCTCYYILC
jgi:hypothetical protein